MGVGKKKEQEDYWGFPQGELCNRIIEFPSP